MSTPEEFEETIEAGVSTLDSFVARVQQDPGGTNTPLADDARATAGARTLAVVGSLARIKFEGDGARFHLGKVIGEGGMGLIRDATQTSLGRQVAVKTLRADSMDLPDAATVATDPQEDVTALKLLHEAWVTGSLEHPNIVPVHDVALDQAGRPLIVLKRIEGETWSALLKDAAEVERRFGAKDLLDWNLRIFLQVCNAISFAHSRGIIHRDLKPGNVMIGSFGEVYVLDWGIAVSLHEEGDGRLPLARDATTIAGTPLYMAPEMLGGVVEHRLSERTDVYLLGSILHEIITGRPPHASSSMAAFVSSVLEFKPDFPGEARGELVAICQKALALDPDQRHESVEALRLAVQDFLQFRGSAIVAEQARRSLADLEERIAAATPTTSATIDGSNQQRDIYHLYGECCFGFKAALRDWPGNQSAIDGLRAASVAMIGHELRSRDLKAAATLLAQLDDPPAELREAVEQLERETEAARREAQKLVQLGRDLDLRRGQRTRTLLILLIGGGFAATPLLRDPALITVTPDQRVRMLLWPLGFLVLTAIAGLLTRRKIQTAINRRFLGAVMLALLAQIVVHLGGMLLELPMNVVHTMLFGLWFCICAMLTITINRRLIYGTLGFLAGFFVSARWPEYRFYAMSAANALMVLNGTVLWLSLRSSRASREDR